MARDVVRDVARGKPVVKGKTVNVVARGTIPNGNFMMSTGRKRDKRPSMTMWKD